MAKAETTVEELVRDLLDSYIAGYPSGRSFCSVGDDEKAPCKILR